MPFHTLGIDTRNAGGPSTLDVPMTMKIGTSVIKFSAAIPISAIRAALAAVHEK